MDINIREVAEFPVVKIPHEVPFPEVLTGDPGVSIVRLDTNQIISNMSSQYQLISHSDILDAVESSLSSNGLKFELSSMMMHGSKDSSMRARYIIKSSGGKIKKDDVLPIVDVNNSYDGLTTFFLQFGIYRVVCSNGMMIATSKKEMINKVHVRDNISITGIFEAVDKWVNEEFWIECMRVEKLADDKPIPIEVIMTDLLRKKESEEFAASELISKYYDELGRNRLAQLNAVTEFAKSLDTERRILLESRILPILTN